MASHRKQLIYQHGMSNVKWGAETTEEPLKYIIILEQCFFVSLLLCFVVKNDKTLVVTMSEEIAK